MLVLNQLAPLHAPGTLPSSSHNLIQIICICLPTHTRACPVVILDPGQLAININNHSATPVVGGLHWGCHLRQFLKHTCLNTQLSQMTGDSVWVVDSFATLLPSQNYWVRASAARRIPYGGNFRTMTSLGSENGSWVWWLMPVSPTLGRESQESRISSSSLMPQ